MPNAPKVKICGITNMDDARAAVELGADYIGFLFYEKSDRYVNPDTAKSISREFPGVKKVALFVDELVGRIFHIAGYVGVDAVQLHGNETPAFAEHLQQYWDVWKAVRVKDEASLEAIRQYGTIDTILLDTYVKGRPGGTGETFNWELAVKAKEYGKNIVLAGGLNPSNVAQAVLAAEPYAVDVSSGVEGDTKGRKSYEKMRQFIESAKTPSVLLRIAERKRKEVEGLYISGEASALAGKCGQMAPLGRRFYHALEAQSSYPSPHLIAEFKITSPSNARKGNPGFRENADPAEIAGIYEVGGAAAMSVLTDSDFKGSIEHLKAVTASTMLPVLRKDFIIDPIQIHEARAYGADAVLLIAALLDDSSLWQYREIANEMGMDCLVEAHNERELKKAVDSGAKIIGINNRDLHTFEESLETTARLAKLVPQDRLIVTESSIHTREDVLKVMESDVDAMLVGTGLMSAGSIPAKMAELLGK